MGLRNAVRKKVKVKALFEGVSGSGKTLSALLMAYGLCEDWSKIALIDTERSGDLYANKKDPDQGIDIGTYKLYEFHNDRTLTDVDYTRAVKECVNAGMQVIIIDSITPHWEYLLQKHAASASTDRNSYTAWAKITPIHREFIRIILETDVHVICTSRVKQEYVLQPNDHGKMVPRKMGLKPVQRDGIEYEFTIVFSVDDAHLSTATKDRTSLFTDKEAFKITTESGFRIRDWGNEEIFTDEYINSVVDEFNACETVKEWSVLKNQMYPHLFERIIPRINKKREEITDLYNKEKQLKQSNNN